MATGLFNLKQVNQAISQGAWSGYIAPKWVEYLVVAGGGAGGTDRGGGGGAGGYSGGGGGWGASGGSSPNRAGGAGGRAVFLNGRTVTWVSGNTTRVYGAVSN